MDEFRRLVTWERRMGKPVNRAMFGFWQWAFVLFGPVGTAFGSFALAQGFWWQGCGIALLGLSFTWVGSTKLFRFVRSRRGGEHLFADGERSEAVESSSESRPPGSRTVRLIGGAALIAAGVLIIVAALAH